ncbi:MAG: PhzF family phenazine biosynthesis protein [Holosporales bacterium]|nr:PhzF family phenazine biosynthesis protein [Holosporales bacterium]
MPPFRCPIWLIDSFTDAPFKGNPAGVCLVDAFPSDAVMQQIAFEVHWSETAFIHRIGEAGNRFRIRWFSPLDEAPICGHATLAAMHFLCENGTLAGDQAIFESRAGELRTIKKHNKITMDFPILRITPCTNKEHIDLLAKILDTQNILEVYKDALIYIVVLARERDVLACEPDLELLKTMDCRAVAITAESDMHACQQGSNQSINQYSTAASLEKKYDFVSRYFAPKVGIPEDPVCGSSYCRLAPLWGQIFKQKEMRARQLSSRDGYVDVLYNELDNTVAISGEARTVLKGEIYI